MADAVANEKQLPRLEAMTLGMILDRAFNLYIRNFGLLFAIMIISQMISQISQIILTQLRGGPLSIATVFYFPVHVLVTLLTTAIGTGAVTIAISNRYLGREITILQSYRFAFRKMWTLLGAKLLAGLVVGAGLIGLVIPGIFLAVIFSLITPAVMLEDISSGKSLGRSLDLTAKFRWQIFALFLIYHLIYYALFGAGSILVAIVSRYILPSLAVRPYLLQLLLAPLLILPTPLLSLFMVLVYYNQRIRKEGFDLTLLAESLARE